jgi:hypothetical protein
MLSGRLYVSLMSSEKTVVPSRVYSSLVGIYFETYSTIFMNLAFVLSVYLGYFL